VFKKRVPGRTPKRFEVLLKVVLSITKMQRIALEKTGGTGVNPAFQSLES
jgi:hypothetical protein